MKNRNKREKKTRKKLLMLSRSERKTSDSFILNMQLFSCFTSTSLFCSLLSLSLSLSSLQFKSFFYSSSYFSWGNRKNMKLIFLYAWNFTSFTHTSRSSVRFCRICASSVHTLIRSLHSFSFRFFPSQFHMG